MNNPGQPFEVPQELRTMLDQGVAQARQGFEKVMKVADEAASTLNSKAGSTKNQADDLRKKTMTFTGQNVAAAFDLAANLVKAKSVEEVMKLQTEYMTHQFAALRGQIQEAGQAVQEQTKAAASEFAAQSKKMQEQAKDFVEKGTAAAKDAMNAVGKGKPGKKG